MVAVVSFPPRGPVRGSKNVFVLFFLSSFPCLLSFCLLPSVTHHSHLFSTLAAVGPDSFSFLLPPPHCCHTTDLHTDSLQWHFFFLVYVLPEWKIYELRDKILEGKKIQVGSFQSWEHWKVELAHAHAHTPQAVCPPSIIRVNTVELAFKWWSLWTIFLSSVLYHSTFGVSALSQCFHSIPASGILASLLFVLLHYSCHKGTRLPFGGEKSNNP